MLNHVALLGRLAQDPELRQTNSGTPVASFDLAVQGYSKDAPADFIPVVCWDKTATFASQWLTKGRQIVVEGRLTARKYTDKDGNKRKTAEIVAENVYFGDSKRDGDGSNAYVNAMAPQQGYGSQTGYPPAPGGYATAQQSFPTSPPMYEEIDEDDGNLPF